MTTCPHCFGSGSVKPLLMARPPAITPSIFCETCQGKGDVSGEKMDWIKRGQSIRDHRVESGETIRDFARKRGLDCITVSRAELGVIDPCVLEGLQ